MSPKDIFRNNNVASTDNGTVSFEELENAFRTPTQYQNFYERPDTQAAPGNAPSDDIPQSLVNPDGENLEMEEPAHVDHNHAMRTGERIARIIDTGIDFTLSNFVAHDNESYKADEKDLHDIAECWGEISEEHGWSIGPEWSLVILYIMVYGPLVKQAVTNRRMNELEARQKALEERMSAFEHHAPDPQTEKTPANDGNPNPNPAPTGSPFTYQPQQ